MFFERDVPYYADHRDISLIPGGWFILYSDWNEIANEARRQLDDADIGIVTSYCPDGIEASEVLLNSSARLKTFYDLDTPVTLARLSSGDAVSYIGPRGLQQFDLVLSYTGGRALDELQTKLGAHRVAPLYGSVDTEVHHRVAPQQRYRADVSYLGTYAEDRQATLETLLVEPARRLPDRVFLIGGAMYPQEFPWTHNIYFVRHLPPSEHPAFYSSSRLTLNVTRAAMAEMGYCPSGRLFEAAACGVPIVTDWWEGIDDFFEPGREILIARSTDEMMEVLAMPDEQLKAIGEAALRRTLKDHTSESRARELERILEQSGSIAMEA